jgi:hypothetical protein
MRMRPILFILIIAFGGSSIAADTPSPEASLNGDEIFQRLVEYNRQREIRLRGYLVRRSYTATNNSGKLYAVEEVRMNYAAPGEKKFELISGSGSALVRELVFSRLRDAEAVASREQSHKESAITPANYHFETLGMEELDGRRCFVVRAGPMHKNKYLFEGRVWIDSEDFAIARIEGHPAANPSFWTRHVEFVRSYAKFGDFWLPTKDATVADIRLYGRKILNIEHYDYVLEVQTPDR